MAAHRNTTALMNQSVNEAARQLSRTRLFGPLEARQIERLAASPRLKLTSDADLFSAGDSAEAVYLVLSGEVALEIADAEGRSLCVGVHRAGGVFGELAILDGGVRSVCARATAPTELLSIAAADFLFCLRTNPDFCLALLRDYAGKLRNANTQVSGVAFRSLYRRVAGLIDDLARRQPGDAVIRITQSECAARLGASREKVNAQLQKLQTAGAVRLTRGRIVVADRAALTRLLDESYS